jgi:hypothetical protein
MGIFLKSRGIVIFALVVIVISAATFPLLTNPNKFIPGFYSSDEPFSVLQGFWWLKYSSLHHLPWTNEFITAYPFGIQHSLVYKLPLWFYVSKFISSISNEVQAYNLPLVFNLIASWLSMLLLVRHLTKNLYLGFFSGAIFALCPYQFARLWQHFALTFTEFMPLYILALIKVYENKRYKDIILCLLVFLLQISFELHYAFFSIVATLCFTLIVERQSNRFSLLKVYLFLIVGIAIVSIAAIFNPLLKTFSSVNLGTPSAYSVVRPFEDLFAQSARPLSYFLPAIMHPVFWVFTEQFIGTPLYGTSLTEHTLYLGWIPLILAFVAFRHWKRNRKLRVINYNLPTADFYIVFFISLAIIAWLFSQPPWWSFGPLKLYMPSFFIYKILPMFRAYCRFGIMVMLAVAVLAGFGLKFILEKFKVGSAKIGIGILFLCLVLFEFWNYPPFKIIDVSKVPQAYYWLKDQPDDCVIAEYPLDIIGPNELYKLYQTRHEKRIINGTIPQTYAHAVAESITKLSNFRTAGVLKWMSVKYVFVHRNSYLESGLVEDREELSNIHSNSGLKFIRTFPAQGCPRDDIICAQKTGPIDVYEVVTMPIEPAVKE